MTTKELLALVDAWRKRAEMVVDIQATVYEIAARELDPIATALCAEVEALRKDAERLREVLLHQTKATLYGFGISLKDDEEAERATNNYIAFCCAAIDAARSRNEHEG